MSSYKPMLPAIRRREAEASAAHLKAAKASHPRSRAVREAAANADHWRNVRALQEAVEAYNKRMRLRTWTETRKDDTWYWYGARGKYLAEGSGDFLRGYIHGLLGLKF